MALYTKLSTQQITALAAHFGLTPPLKTKGILEGTVNTYYRLTYPQKNYYLKIDEVGEKKRLLNEIEIFEVLGKLTKKLSFKTPVPRLTTHKKYFIPFGKKFVLLFDEVLGKSPKTLNLKQLEVLGANLACLHKLTQGKKIPLHRFNLKGQKRVFDEIKTKLIKKHPTHFLYIKNKLQNLIKNEPQKIPSGLVHADLFPENTLYKGNSLLGILDFEAAGTGAFLFDIGVCMHALCHKQTILSPTMARAFLKGYQKNRILKPVEMKYFGYYLEQSAMRFLLTRLRDFELKDGAVKASPFKDYREYVERFDQIPNFLEKLKLPSSRA